MNFKRTPLQLAISLACISLSLPAWAEETPKTSGENLDAVVIIGTNRSDVTALESSAPVDVLSSEQLLNTGAQDLSGALTALSPSFNYPQSPQGAFAGSIAQGASLRGLASDQVLVLINGKRRHTSANVTRQGLVNGRGAAAVDLSLIPLTAIQRVEILRDGAAAQYGSDAIAGVINIVLKQAEDGGNIGYRFGGYDKGDGLQRKLSGWKGFSLPNDGFLTLSFDAGSQDPASDTNPDNRIFYPGSPNANTALEQSHPNRTWRWGSGKVSDQYNLFANTEFGITSSLSAYGFASYGHKITDAESFFDPPSVLLSTYGSAAFARYPSGRVPITRYGLEDYAATGGLRFDADDWGKFDLALSYGTNIVKSSDLNAINPSLGAASPSNIYTGKREFDQTNLTLDWTRDFAKGVFYKPVTLSAGLAWRKENYKLTEGEPAGWQNGNFYFAPDPATGRPLPGYYAGITNVDAAKLDRRVLAAFLDAETHFTEKLSGGAAIRAEDYSDVGNTTNGKLSLRFEATPTFATRATASTGYRAPSLVQSGFSSFSVQVIERPTGSGNWVEVPQRTLRADSPEAALLGGKALKPEKSTNFSLGFVWKPIERGSLTLDVFQINIDDRVTLSDQLAEGLVTPVFAGTQYSNIRSAAFYSNVTDTRTRGFELTGQYLWELERYGRINFTGGFSKVSTEITKLRDVGNIRGSQIVGRATQGLIEDGTPENKLVLGANWVYGNWSVNIAQRRYGEWTARNATNAALDQTFSPQWVTDLDASYKFNKKLRLSIGAINLFDTHPDKLKGAQLYGVPKYSITSPEGAQGAFYYTSLSYDL